MREHKDRWRWWPLVSLLPFGFGAWAPLIAGVRCRVPRWSAWGASWSGVVILVLALVLDAGHPTRFRQVVSGLLILVAWAGGAITSFRIWGDYQRRMARNVHADAPSASPTAPGSKWPAETWAYAVGGGAIAFGVASAIDAALRYGA